MVVTAPASSTAYCTTFAMVADALPPWSVDHYLTGVRFAVTNAHGHGVTGFKDASASEEMSLQVNGKADQAGELAVHVAACMYDTSMEQDELHWRNSGYGAQYASEHLHTNFTKIFLDGIPTMSKTAAVIEPYQKVEEDETDNFGSLHVEQNELINWVDRARMPQDSPSRSTPQRIARYMLRSMPSKRPGRPAAKASAVTSWPMLD